MNVLILSRSLHRGGIETHILMLSEKLKNAGHNVVVASDNLLEKARFDAIGIPVYEIKFMTHNPVAMIQNVNRLKKIIDNNKIEVVHCQWRICSLYMEFLHRLRGVEVPFVWSNHVLLKPSKLKSNFTFYGYKAIVSSKDCMKSMLEDYHLPSEKVELVYNGIEFGRYTYDDPGINVLKERLKLNNEYVITMLCRFEAIKNHKCMIEALNILVNEKHIPNLKCVIVGEGKEDYVSGIKSLVSAYHLNDVVVFAGFTESVSTLGLTNLMVLPSQAEGFPISVLEAFAMKVPVIRTRTGGYTDVKGLCLEMDFNDHIGLAEKVVQVMNGGSDIEKMCDDAYEFVKNTCTSDVMLDKLVCIYNEAIENNK